MRNNKVIIGIVLLIAILLVAVGYAAISAVGLNITGNVSATANDENFKVKFTGTPVVSNDTKVNATIVDDLNATINVQGLTSKGDKESARYTVINQSADLSAELIAEVIQNTNPEYFGVTYEIEEPEILKAGETTTILVTIELIKTPITSDVSTTVKVEVTAEPAQPISIPDSPIIPPDTKQIARMVLAEDKNATENYLNSAVTKNKIENIKFKLGTQPPKGTIEEYTFNAAESPDESIMGYYTDADNNGLYELTFVSNKIIAPNMNAQCLFLYLENLTDIDFNNFTTYGVTNMSFMFASCTKLTTLDLSNFNTSKVTNMSGMFESCSALTTLDVSNFDTSKVTDMSWMFNRCTKLTTLNVSGFDTSSVTDMSKMFMLCQKLTTLDVSDFDTSNVTNMERMFFGDIKLTTLDLSNFNTSKVTSMKRMFLACVDLTTIYVTAFDETNNTGWTTSAVTDSTEMFINCTSLVGESGTIFDSNHIDAEYARIDKPEAPDNAPGYLTTKT